MFNKINDFFDIKNEEEYLEKYSASEYKKIRNLNGLMLIYIVFIFALSIFYLFQIDEKKEGEIYLYNQELNKTKILDYYHKPSFSSEKIKEHTKNVLTDMLTTNFGKVDKKLAYFKKYFSNKAWSDFERIILEDFSTYLKENRLVSSLTVTKEPILISGGNFYDGRKFWTYQTEAFITYKGSLKFNRKEQVKLDIIMTFNQVSPTKNPYGIEIDEVYIIRGRN